jgi:hypothetical protein
MKKQIKTFMIISLIIVALILIKYRTETSSVLTDKVTVRFYDSDKNLIGQQEASFLIDSSSFSIINFEGTGYKDVPDISYLDFTATISNIGSNMLTCNKVTADPPELNSSFPSSKITLIPGRSDVGALTSSLIPISPYESTTSIRFNITITCASSGFSNVTHTSSVDILIKTQRVPNYCYQESATSATGSDGTCGLSYSGVEKYTGWTNGASLFDKSWTTAGNGGTTGSYAGVNYTKPSGALGTSIWKVKDEFGQKNLAIPSTCWDYYPGKIQFRLWSLASSSYAEVKWQCYGGPNNWIVLRSYSSTAFSMAKMYEEGVYWDMP